MFLCETQIHKQTVYFCFIIIYIKDLNSIKICTMWKEWKKIDAKNCPQENIVIYESIFYKKDYVRKFYVL